MRIGFICNQSNCVSGASNGVRMQALVWKDALENNGHVVVLINAWDEYNWNSFDIIHVFSYCDDSLEIVRRLKKRGIKVVVSPIIDSIKSKSIYRSMEKMR